MPAREGGPSLKGKERVQFVRSTFIFFWEIEREG